MATVFDRLIKHAKVNEQTGCVEWTGSCDRRGYGQINIDGIPQRAHRVMYSIVYGSIPEGYVVCHECDNRKCINPHHLALGTQGENTLDMIKKGRDRFARSNLTEDQVREIKFDTIRTNQELARKFNVNERTIQNIKVGFTWNHIKPLSTENDT